MTIKHLYNKFNVHVLYYVVAFITVITGQFKEFIVFTLIIVIHELGHVITAIHYNWKIDKIILLPFGGLTIFNEHLNKPLKEEFIILICGPLLQIAFYIIANFTNPSTILTNYHWAILLFNLIPIVPLDGSKLLNILFNLLLPFKISHKLTSIFSIVVIGAIMVCIKIDLLMFLILIFICIKVINDLRSHNYIFNKFLLERHLYGIKFSKIKHLKRLNFKLFFKDFTHVFSLNGKQYNEHDKLCEIFDNNE